jgi:hypothetical protein
MIIAIDFDGTIVTHEYPKIGKLIEFEIPSINSGDLIVNEKFTSIDVIKSLISLGHKIILFTMRSDNELDEAVKFLQDNDIELFGINTNPEQSSWTNSPKAYAQIYIDDAALGCPLLFNDEIGSRPFVDWRSIFIMLNNRLS